MEFTICDAIVGKTKHIVFAVDALLPPSMLRLKADTFPNAARYANGLLTQDHPDLDVVRTLLRCVQHGGVNVGILTRPTSAYVADGDVHITGAFWDDHVCKLFQGCKLTTPLEAHNDAWLVTTPSTEVEASNYQRVVTVKSWLQDLRQLYHAIVDDSPIPCTHVKTADQAANFLAAEDDNVIIAQRESTGLLIQHWCFNRADIGSTISFGDRTRLYELTDEQATRLQTDRRFRYFSVMRVDGQVVVHAHVAKSLRRDMDGQDPSGAQNAIGHVLVDWLHEMKPVELGAIYILSRDSRTCTVAEFKDTHLLVHVLPYIARSRDVTDVSTGIKKALVWSYHNVADEHVLVTITAVDKLKALRGDIQPDEILEFQEKPYRMVPSAGDAIVIHRADVSNSPLTVVQRATTDQLYEYVKATTADVKVDVDPNMYRLWDPLLAIDVRSNIAREWLWVGPSQSLYDCNGDIMRLRIINVITRQRRPRNHDADVRNRRLQTLGLPTNSDKFASQRALVKLCQDLGFGVQYHGTNGTVDNMAVSKGDVTFRVRDLRKVVENSKHVKISQSETLAHSNSYSIQFHYTNRL